MISLFWTCLIFPPVLSFDGKNEVVLFLPFTYLNILFLPQSQWDNGLVSSSVKMLGLHCHNIVLHQSAYWHILMQSDHILCIYSTLCNHNWYSPLSWTWILIHSSHEIMYFVLAEWACHYFCPYFYLLYSHYCNFQLYFYFDFCF